MGLREIGETLPPGFRFYPSDEELVCHYLFKKIAKEEVHKGTLVEIDLHTCEPWQLPEVAKLNSSEWYFFSFRDRKYATGFRTNRATTTGYWKATGKDRTVLDPRTRTIVGMRKTLVFYKNRAPNGIKTGWIMHEFRLENPLIPPKEDWVLCRVFHKLAKCDNMICTSNYNNMYEAADHLAISPPNMDNHASLPYGGYCPTAAAVATSGNFCEPANNNQRNNYLHLSQEMNINKDDDDQYGFLLDMNFEDTSLQHGVVDMDMRFDDDNSLVFI